MIKMRAVHAGEVATDDMALPTTEPRDKPASPVVDDEDPVTEELCDRTH